jgi:PAS domain S-box-containing protein
MNHDPPASEEQLRQLRLFLAWLLPIALGIVALLLVIAFFFPSRDLVVASASICCYSLLLLWGRIQLSRGNVWTTVGTICGGLFALALGVTVMTPSAAQVLILLPFLAVGVALPYISGRALRRLSWAGWLMAVLVIAVEEVDKYGSVAALIPHGILMIFGVAAAGALVLVLLWQFSNRLNTTLAQTRTANAALLEANAKLGEQHTQLLDDIARRQRAEEALRRSEEQFRLLFEVAPIGMAITGVDGRFLRVNQALCATLGYSEGDLLLRTIADITHPDDLLTHVGLSQELMDGTRSFYQIEKRYMDRNGQVIDALLHVVLVRDTQDQPLHFIGQVVDITERKRAEEQRLALDRKLLETQKLESIGVLAGGIAHDFNNLLGHPWQRGSGVIGAAYRFGGTRANRADHDGWPTRRRSDAADAGLRRQRPLCDRADRSECADQRDNTVAGRVGHQACEPVLPPRARYADDRGRCYTASAGGNESDY